MPFASAPVTTQSAKDAYTLVLQNVGANLPKRDIVDERILHQLTSGKCNTGDSYGTNTGIIDSAGSVGGWPLLKSTTPANDSDHDGMPDTWEIANGLNPNNADDRNLVSKSGFTMLEAFINSIK
jgi:pectate lyase